MSGPKVINLEAVRRRRQRQCIAAIRELRDTVAEWRAALERAGLLSNDMGSEADSLFARLESMREKEQWEPLLSEIAAQGQFFRTGTENANQSCIKETASFHQRRRGLEMGLAMLQRELQASGIAPPSELDQITQKNAADSAELSRLESLLQTVFDKLPGKSAAQPAVNAQQAELASALKTDNTGVRTFREWLASRMHEDTSQQAKNDRLARALAELELQAPADLAAPLLAKARAISSEPAAERRHLLTDSLLLEADELCGSLRRRKQALNELQHAIAALEPFQSAEADSWRQRLSAALNNPSALALRQLAAAAQEWYSAEATREEAALRREAVLTALAELGYEVREGMATAWAENGRVVVRKPSDPNYGVELASPAAGAAVQTRLVAFGDAERSAAEVQRDKEVETSWCGEFQRLRELLEKDGFAPKLLHATLAGELPVKVVPPIEAERHTRTASRPQTRQQSNR